MKWGIRRTKEQLEHDRYSIENKLKKRLPSIVTPNNLKIKGISDHALERTEDPTRRVTAKEITKALTTPIHIGTIKTDKQGRKSQRFIGYDATVNVNPDNGLIVTVWKTGRRTVRKYSKDGER